MHLFVFIFFFLFWSLCSLSLIHSIQKLNDRQIRIFAFEKNRFQMERDEIVILQWTNFCKFQTCNYLWIRYFVVYLFICGNFPLRIFLSFSNENNLNNHYCISFYRTILNIWTWFFSLLSVSSNDISFDFMMVFTFVARKATVIKSNACHMRAQNSPFIIISLSRRLYLCECLSHFCFVLSSLSYVWANERASESVDDIRIITSETSWKCVLLLAWCPCLNLNLDTHPFCVYSFLDIRNVFFWIW